MALTLHMRAWQRTARTLCVWSVVGLGFVLPITPAGTSLFLACSLLFWLSSGHWTDKLAALRASPVALAMLAFCGLLLIGSCYGLGTREDKLHYLVKYLSLLLIPLLISLRLTTLEKLRALAGFCAAMGLTLLLSTLIWLGVFVDPARWFSNATPVYPVVFKMSITQGVFMAFVAYFFCLAALRWRRTWAFWPLLLLAVWASANVMLMVPGRTGYVIFGLLLLLLFLQGFGRRGLFWGSLVTLLLAASAYQFAPIFHDRIDDTLLQMAQLQPGKGTLNSVSQRTDYALNTFAIIRQSPLIGVGVGGFPVAYAEQVRGTAVATSNNPHNQYLLLTAQMGVLGLLALLSVYVVQWRAALRLAAPFSNLALAVLIGFMIGNLLNSFMLDMAERVFFAWSTGLLFSISPPAD